MGGNDSKHSRQLERWIDKGGWCQGVLSMHSTNNQRRQQRQHQTASNNCPRRVGGDGGVCGMDGWGGGVMGWVGGWMDGWMGAWVRGWMYGSRGVGEWVGGM